MFLDVCLHLAHDPAPEVIFSEIRGDGAPLERAMVGLDPHQPSEEALRAILLAQLEEIRANVEGVLDDRDVEFLHDLRVAVRRTRSALTQITGVLPHDAVEHFRSEFKWLGTMTGSCRDFDVFRLEMNNHIQQLDIAGSHLEPIHRPLERSRNEAHQQVRVTLRSPRFHRLLDQWNDFLTIPLVGGSSPPNANRPVAELAGLRILKAHKRILKRGSKLDGDPPAEAMHRLRIDAKKLRYLLEFFAGLYPKTTIKELIKELKRLQDILGGFNDMQVQRAELAEFVRELTESADTTTETLEAMDRLASEMARRQEAYRHAFAGRFAEFADRSSLDRYEQLFGDVTSSREPEKTGSGRVGVKAP